MRRIQTGILLINLVAWSVIGGPSSIAQTDAASTASLTAVPKFEAFSILRERNIFDPLRQPTAVTTPTELPTQQPAFRSLTLRGMLIDKGRAVAFFEQSPSGALDVTQVGKSVVGFRLKEVHTDRIVLEKDKATYTLMAHQQLTQTGEGPWILAEAPEPAPGGQSSTATPKSETPEPSAEDSTGSTKPTSSAKAPSDETLKKLMERRRKETGE